MSISVCSDQILLPTPEPCDDCEILKNRVEDLEDKVGDYIETDTTYTLGDGDTGTFETVLKGDSVPSNLHIASTEYVNTKSPRLTAGANITLTDMEDGTIKIDSSGGGGGGSVTSVNEKVGDVILRATDIKVSSTDTNTVKQKLDSKQDTIVDSIEILRDGDWAWRVIKFSDGTYEAQGRAELSVTITSSVGNMYSSYRYTAPLPADLGSINITNAYGICTTGNQGGVYVSISSLDEDSLDYYVMSPTSRSSEVRHLGFYVYGQWE